MPPQSSDDEYTPGQQQNRIAKKSSSAGSAQVLSNYSTRRQAARRAFKAIASSTFDKSMENFNPDMSQRERRKLNKKLNLPTVKRPPGAVYDERGRHIVSGADICDCLNEKCPGCWFECAKCGGSKCGIDCRVFRKHPIDSIEYHGYDKVVKNPVNGRN